MAAEVLRAFVVGKARVIERKDEKSNGSFDKTGGCAGSWVVGWGEVGV